MLKHVSGRTWITLILADATVWAIAEIQHSGGSLATAFDVVWVASLLGFFALVALSLATTMRTRHTGRSTT